MTFSSRDNDAESEYDHDKGSRVKRTGYPRLPCNFTGIKTKVPQKVSVPRFQAAARINCSGYVSL